MVMQIHQSNVGGLSIGIQSIIFGGNSGSWIMKTSSASRDTDHCKQSTWG